MSEKVFPDMTPAQRERLALLAEECGELVQDVCKALRHGWDSHHPDTGNGNKTKLTEEAAHVLVAIALMVECGDIDPEWLYTEVERKIGRVWLYLHHNSDEAQRLAGRVDLVIGEAIARPESGCKG